MKSDLANNLKAVLEEMSQEQFDQVWSEITALNLKGPSFVDAIEYFSVMQNQLGNFELMALPSTVIDDKYNYRLAA